MTSDEKPVGYKQPPIGSQFKKGQSGNPSGRPKRVPDFFEDAAAILGAPVTGQSNGKEITVSATHAMFRRMCIKALKGDNAALRRLIELMLTLEPGPPQLAEHDPEKISEARRRICIKLGLDPDKIGKDAQEPNPRMDAYEKQADAIARNERKRLLREARQRKEIR